MRKDIYLTDSPQKKSQKRFGDLVKYVKSNIHIHVGEDLKKWNGHLITIVNHITFGEISPLLYNMVSNHNMWMPPCIIIQLLPRISEKLALLPIIFLEPTFSYLLMTIATLDSDIESY